MALSEESFRAAGPIDALEQLLEVHACRKVIEPFCREDECTHVIIFEPLQKQLFQPVDAVQTS